MKYDAIIIGAGPAGLAAGAALKETQTLILEKTDGPGKKLLLSGAGQCNVTHSGPMSAYKTSYGDKWSFVRPALMAYTNEDFIGDLARQGLACEANDQGKVFPVTYKSQDVLEAMLAMVRPLKVYTNQEVVTIEEKDHWYVHTKDQVYQADHVIVATGGMTYPKTGSTGDGYRLAKGLKLDLVPMRFALAPVYVKAFTWAGLQGISFKDITVDLYRQKKVKSYVGDLLLTHFGLSGPVIINNSRDFLSGDELRVNFTSYKRPEALEEALLDWIKQEPKKQVKTLLTSHFIQQKVGTMILKDLAIDENLKAADLSKKHRKALVQAMTAWPFEIDKVGKSHIAMATAGGVSLSNLDKKTHGVKGHPGLYFVGECLDVDGDTGGYNIQYAVASGLMAGRSIKKNILEG